MNTYYKAHCHIHTYLPWNGNTLMSLFFKSQLKLQEQNMNYTTPQMKYTNYTASALGVNVGIVHYDNETKWNKALLISFSIHGHNTKQIHDS